MGRFCTFSHGRNNDFDRPATTVNYSSLLPEKNLRFIQKAMYQFPTLLKESLKSQGSSNQLLCLGRQVEQAKKDYKDVVDEEEDVVKKNKTRRKRGKKSRNGSVASEATAMTTITTASSNNAMRHGSNFSSDTESVGQSVPMWTPPSHPHYQELLPEWAGLPVQEYVPDYRWGRQRATIAACSPIAEHKERLHLQIPPPPRRTVGFCDQNPWGLLSSPSEADWSTPRQSPSAWHEPDMNSLDPRMVSQSTYRSPSRRTWAGENIWGESSLLPSFPRDDSMEALNAVFKEMRDHSKDLEVIDNAPPAQKDLGASLDFTSNLSASLFKALDEMTPCSKEVDGLAETPHIRLSFY
jgi:hypothetical protein